MTVEIVVTWRIHFHSDDGGKPTICHSGKGTARYIHCPDYVDQLNEMAPRFASAMHLAPV